jgi:hypothetical protein
MSLTGKQMDGVYVVNKFDPLWMITFEGCEHRYICNSRYEYALAMSEKLKKQDIFKGAATITQI